VDGLRWCIGFPRFVGWGIFHDKGICSPSLGRVWGFPECVQLVEATSYEATMTREVNTPRMLKHASVNYENKKS
jgi:hypothetical protein